MLDFLAHFAVSCFVVDGLSSYLSISVLLLFQVPEYCKVLEEAEILENSFQLLFAFDEIVALGYRESVNLAQIRTFIEMDSHEERVINAVRRVSILNFYVYQACF